MGAAGAIVATVEDADDFEAYAKACSFSPNGTRGVGLPRCNMWGATFSEYKDNFDTVVYKPENGKLLIFRSHLEHAVEKHTDEDMRFTLSHNFVK